MTAERWVPVPYPQWENFYSVSDRCRLRSERSGSILSTPQSNGKYCIAGFTVNGVHATKSLHVVVAKAFLGERPEGMVIRHLNSDPTDNRIENLAYGTPKENIADSLAAGTNYASNKTHCPRGHEYSGENLRVTNNGNRRCRACARERGKRRLECCACKRVLVGSSYYRHLKTCRVALEAALGVES